MNTKKKLELENQGSNSLKHSDFSIDHILNKAGNNSEKCVSSVNNCSTDSEIAKYEWLHCSRYCPPRIPRNLKREIQKRQLSRHPRIPFTSYQLGILEQKFKESPYLSSEEVIGLSNQLQLADVRVKIWFQNRRAREKREKNLDTKQQYEKQDNSPQTSICYFEERFSHDSTIDQIICEKASNEKVSISPEIRTNCTVFENSSLNLSPRMMEEIFQNNRIHSTYLISNETSLFMPNVNILDSNHTKDK